MGIGGGRDTLHTNDTNGDGSRRRMSPKRGAAEQPDDFASIHPIALNPHPFPLDSTASQQSRRAQLSASPGKERRRQKKTAVACLPCQRSHYPCDEGRPCRSCLRRGRPSQCVDGMKKRAKYLELAMSQTGDREEGAQTRTSRRKLTNRRTSGTAEDTVSDSLHFLADSLTRPHPEITSPTAGPQSPSLPSALPPKDTLEVVPFNYASSYHRVLEGLQRRLTSEGMSRVCQAFARFRPSLIAHLRALSETDLSLMERLFQRTVRELQEILPLTGAPHVVWRRTGEVAWVSAEFPLLTGWSLGSLADGRRTIFEILGEQAIVSYWEQYAACVLERCQTSFRVLGALLRPDGRALSGAWWITVRKDIFDIPLAIVGCFLPNLWRLLDTGTRSGSEGGPTDNLPLAASHAYGREDGSSVSTVD